MSRVEAPLAVLAGAAVLLLAALLLVNWWHRRRDARAERLRRGLQPLLAGPARRDPAPSELAWMDGLSPGDGRMVLVAGLEALPGLDAAVAARVRDVLRRSRHGRREVARLRHRSALRRIEACRFAGRLGDTDAVPLLLERLGDRDSGVRREAIRALGDLRAVATVGAIVEAIEAMGEWGNLLLLMALIRMGPESAPAIGTLLDGPEPRSPAMIKALLQVTSRLGVATDPAAIRALASHADPEIRVEAVRVLGCLAPDPASAEVCLAAMDDPEWPVRAIAASSLGRLGEARALSRLAGAMGDPAYWVRHHVAEAMAALGEPGTAALREALHDANPFVRDMATQTLFMSALVAGEAA